MWYMIPHPRARAEHTSRPGASFRPARARRSRDHLGIELVRSKLPLLCSSELVTCLAGELAEILAVDPPL